MREKIFHYSEEFKIRTYDADFTRTVSPTSVFGFMQELATVHAQMLGLGYEDSKENGFYWVIGRSKYDFRRLPGLFEVISVKTWPAGIDGLCALRRFEFSIGQEVIGEGLTYWLMLDCETLRPCKPKYFYDMTKDLPILDTDHFKLKKEPMPSEMEFVFEKTMGTSDLDWNNHVNNLNYSRLIYDSIPKVILEQKKIVSMQINYLKEVHSGDTISIFLANESNQYFTEGRIDGKSVFTGTLRLE